MFIFTKSIRIRVIFQIKCYTYALLDIGIKFTSQSTAIINLDLNVINRVWTKVKDMP